MPTLQEEEEPQQQQQQQQQPPEPHAGEWYATLPVVTKTWTYLLFGFGLGVFLNALDPMIFVFRPDLAFLHFQIWRVLSNFTFAGSFGPSFAMLLLMIFQFVARLEKKVFEKRLADFIYMLFFLMTLMIFFGTTVPVFRFPVYSKSLAFALVYVWACCSPKTSVSLLGLFSVEAFYVPWAYLFVDLLLTQNMMPQFFGICMGHAYVFVKVTYPRLRGGFQPLVTPIWLVALVANWAKAAPDVFGPQAEPPRPEKTATPIRPGGARKSRR